ncbi:serine/threonine-protein kinase CTR1 [Acrasis kona]|uniref:Serine/threonine-protein kinase CTR1 n=1 Tax=Acrasis kona TaxID=1008807 RepID=A0AAW2YKI9_9EUKA
MKRRGSLDFEVLSDRTEIVKTEKTYPLEQHLQTNVENVVMCEEVARGGFATVHRANFNSNIVAVKKLLSIRTKNEKDRRKLRKEVSIMCELKRLGLSNHFVDLIGYDLNSFSIIMEYMGGGDLYRYLQRTKHTIDLHTKLSWAVELSEALHMLHNVGFIHTDLKSLNILLDSSHTKLKIGDLTDVCSIEDCKNIVSHGTPYWMAPEVIRQESCNEKSDVFSLGVILWEIITQRKPYEGYNALEVIELIGNKNVCKPFRLQIPDDVDPRYSKIIKMCWLEDPSQRSSSEQIWKMLVEIKHNLK